MFWGINLSRFPPSAFPFSSLIKAPFWFVALRQLHSGAQNKKAARFSGLCFLNSKPTEEEIWQKKQRGLEEWHVQEGISLGWRRGESWRNSKQWESARVLLCSGSLGHKEMFYGHTRGQDGTLSTEAPAFIKAAMSHVMWEQRATRHWVFG